MAQIVEKTEMVAPSDKTRMCIALALREAVDYGWITQNALDDIQELTLTFNDALSTGKTVVCQDVAYALGDEPWPEIHCGVDDISITHLTDFNEPVEPNTDAYDETIEWSQR